MNSKARVLVLGGAGYIGSVLTEHLLGAGYRVTVADNLFYQQRSLFHLAGHPLFDFVFGDVRDESLMRPLVKDADILIPLAAVVGAPACDRDPALARSLNFEAVGRLNKIRSPGQLLVFPATDSSYGTKPSHIPCDEDTPLEPVSLYGRTKAEAEAEILGSPNAISLRLATVFGVSPRLRLDNLVNHFVYAAVNDGTIVIFEKHVKRNFVHVRDVADAFIFAIENSASMIGRPFNMGHSEANITKEELALRIKKHVPNFYIHFAEIGTDPDKRNFTILHERLRRLGFEAKRSLDYGIQELIKAYRMLRGRGPHENVR